MRVIKIFRAELQNAMLEKNLTVHALTDILELGQSTLTRLLKNQRELEFTYVLKVVRYLLPNDEIRVMSEFMVNEITKPKNFKLAIEYCSMNRLLEIMGILLNKAAESKNEELSGEIYTVYSHQLCLQKSEISAQELFTFSNNIRCKYKESKILSEIQSLYALYFMKEYSFFNFQLSILNLEKQINEIDCPFMRNSFLTRFSELMHIVKLNVHRDIPSSRKYASYVLNSNNAGFMYHCSSLFSLGYSYFFEDPAKAISYFEQAKDIYIANGRIDIAEIVDSTIEFIKIYWDIPVTNVIDVENHCYYLIKNGDNEKGINKLLEIESNSEPDPYRYFFIGEGTKDVTWLYKSLKLFIKRGDYFISDIVVNSLIALGENEEVISLFLHK
ncbi:hypothetical protein AN964_14185 [Heyndrickxia shackletonii]|uniref:HTH cro/C1-type domain-containing protein n=1 Tax=Heyndrickxia shackletonii TaxID=157838 RepID=A0A0Q3TLH2_9BACI|nr:AimR family lysis-lysogeny pheromone receptor [Heyndrickxia shackletonii]KQL54529.1 hypothetical protein AN964_14185 [Heyndrickxia shackletonii]NEZ02061.1 hypothetical protein [Heyndrickxia shackletonii]